MAAMRKLFVLLTFISLSSLSFAQSWQANVLKQQSLNTSNTYRLIQFKNTKTHETVRLNVVTLDQQAYKARVADQKPFLNFLSFQRIYETTKEQGATLGINGGYFTPKNQPLGLVILNGKRTSPLAWRSHLLSGLVLINQKGQVSLVKRNTTYKKALYALQAGPFLIQPSGNLSLNKSKAVRRRTALALAKNHLIVISSSPITLYQLGYFLKYFPKVFGVSRVRVALNLDGGSSTAMTLFFPNKSSLLIPEILPVRNALLFDLKQKP